MLPPSPSNDPSADGPKAAVPPPRDGRGRFAPDVPANPFGRRVAALREALVDAVSEADISAITLMMFESAKTGSESAAKLVYQYVLGKPTAGADPDRVDHEEWRQRMERPATKELEAGIQGRPPLGIGLVCGRAFDDINRIEAAEQAQQSVADDLRKMAEAERRGVPGVAKGSPKRSSHGKASPSVAGQSQAHRSGGKA